MRDHSLVPSCGQRKLCPILDWIHQRYDYPTGETTEVLPIIADGGFVVRRSSRCFNAVASDQALEQTINRDGKSQGCVIGFTVWKDALTRWMVTRHITAQYTEAFKELCHSNKEAKITNYAEHGKTRMARDERDVAKIAEYVRSSQNPFDLETVPDEPDREAACG